MAGKTLKQSAVTEGAQPELRESIAMDTGGTLAEITTPPSRSRRPSSPSG
ncbi:hypothetical protein [Methanoculleus frigidifontis]|nr:hypothetical protein [Methanoculleus sp. FWC-SCC1]